MNQNKVIVVAGSTASGKTSLAVQLAGKLHSEIISADSRQIYRGMDLGTGKDLHEYKTPSGTITHHMIDIADPEQIYSLYNYQKDCYSALQDCFARNITPIICGGTGLYIEAVLKKYKIPNVPENVEFRFQLQEQSHEELVEELKNSAPDIYGETDISSKKRVIRSLEVADYRKTRKVSYSSDNAIDLDPTILITEWDPELLRKRITIRMNERFDLGMIDEVKLLRDSGISDQRMDLLGMEYRAINNYLKGETTYDEMFLILQTEIFRLAKRQRTWFRGMERRGFTTHSVKEASLDIAIDLLRDEDFLI